MSDGTKIIILALISVIVAQVLKFIINYVKTRKVEATLLVTTGSMPSSHSSMVTTAALSIGLFVGFDDVIFALALVVALVIIHDSFGIRYESSKHARELNKIKIRLNLIEDIEAEEKKLKESLGHKPIEVLAGIAVGVLIAVVGYFVLR
jgi:acid phosphatase family membrane protein YuiD